jgi:hypothetical protein
MDEHEELREELAAGRGDSRTDKLSAALAKAQGEMKNPAMDAENPHFKSKYTTLATVRDAITPALAKHELALTFTTQIRDGGVALIGRLMHTSGQSLRAEWPITIGKPQAMASEMTYGKRQLATALCFVAGDQDDDANTAQEAATANEKTASGRPTPDAVAAKQRQEKAAIPKKKWRGPLGIVELKNNLKAFNSALTETETQEQIETLYFGDEYTQVIDQCKVDLPDWFEKLEGAVNKRMNSLLDGTVADA